MTTTIRTYPIDMAYDEETAEEAATRISQTFDVEVRVVTRVSTTGWPEVVVSGPAANVRGALEEGWGMDGGLNGDPVEMLDLDCPKRDCDGRLKLTEATRRDPVAWLGNHWAVCEFCALEVDVDALLENVGGDPVEFDDLMDAGRGRDLYDLALRVVHNKRNGMDYHAEVDELDDLLHGSDTHSSPDREWEAHYRAHSSSITGLYEAP